MSFPPHIHFVGQFLSQLNFVAQSPNIHTKCLIQDYWFWKAQNCVLMQKKWSGRLVRFLHFLFWLKTCFLWLQSLQGKLHFLASSHNFLTFLKKCCFTRLFNIVQNGSKSLLLRQKSVPVAWSDSYIFCFDKNLLFHGFN
mgnify:CR=1 FL=1